MMRRLFSVGILLVASTVLLVVTISAKINNSAIKVIQPASKKELVSIIAHIEKNKQQFIKEDIIDVYESFARFKGYIVDINNDGKPEYVLVGQVGSEHFLDLHVFSVTPAGIKRLNNEFREFMSVQSRHFFSHEFINPHAHQSEFLISVNGKIYMCINPSLDEESLMKRVYLWENGKISLVSVF